MSLRWSEGFIPNPATWLNQDRWLDEPTNHARAPPVTGGMLVAAAKEAGGRLFLQRNGIDPDGKRPDDQDRVDGVIVPLPRLNQIPRI
jgi:hypothetical protein